MLTNFLWQSKSVTSPQIIITEDADWSALSDQKRENYIKSVKKTIEEAVIINGELEWLQNPGSLDKYVGCVPIPTSGETL